MIFSLAVIKRKQQQPNVSASEVMDALIHGDRLAEVINESAINLMSGETGLFEPYETDPKLPMYLVT